VAVVGSVGTGLLAGIEPMVPLDVAAVVAVAALVAWQPYLGLLALLVLTIRYPNGNEFAAYAPFAGGGIALLALARRIPAVRVALPLVALLVVSLPSIPLRPAFDEGDGGKLTIPVIHVAGSGTISQELIRWLGIGALATMFCLAAHAVRTPRRLRFLQGTLMVAAVYPIVDALRQYAAGDLTVRPGQSDSFAAVRGPFEHPNYFAFYLLVIMTIGLVTLIEERRLAIRLALVVLLGASSVCLVLTYTRSAWVGFAIVVLVLGLLAYRFLLIAGVVLLAIAAFALPGSARKVEARFSDLSDRAAAQSSNSWDWRYNMWKKMVPYGWHTPAFGRGFGSYDHQTVKVFGLQNRDYPLYIDASGHVKGFGAHNDYVKTFVESGLLGLALWVLWLLGLLGTAIRATRAPPVRGTAFAMVALMVAFIAISATDNIQGYPLVLMSVAVLTGGAAGVAYRAASRRA
jgi:O-antigen ligase